MNDFLVVILVFVLIIAGLLIERYYFAKHVQKTEEKLLDELSKAIKAIISKNANDYVMTTSIDKVSMEDNSPKDPDLVPEENLSDDEFYQAIHKDIKE